MNISTKGTSKKGVGLSKLAPPKPQAPVAEVPDAQPRSKRKKRIALAFRVTPEQYRQLIEMRLNEESTIHKLLVRAVGYYFEREHGMKFAE